jgi:peptide deformylase
MGNALLEEKSQPVDQFDTPELHQLIQDMQDTMLEKQGAGLAAPQIGVLKRVVVFGLDGDNARYPGRGHIPLTILINPHIDPLTEEIAMGWEGCLSLPGLRGRVPRFNLVRYTGYDATGARIDRTVDGFHARVVQHECDHLDGILYPQRMPDMAQFGFVEELADKLGC